MRKIGTRNAKPNCLDFVWLPLFFPIPWALHLPEELALMGALFPQPGSVQRSPPPAREQEKETDKAIS
jgi:hypothetical protein